MNLYRSDKIKKSRNVAQRKESISHLFSPVPRSAISSPSINSDQSPKTLADHVAAFFERRFNSKTMATEMGYNLRDACQRYRNSEQINLFWGIITGQIEEMVYHHQMRSISQLLQHLMKMKTYFSYQQESTLPKARKAIVSEPNSPLSIIANHRLSSLSLPSMQGRRGSISK
jgi:hypothetical protein